MRHTGLIISHKSPLETIDAIIRADKKGVETVWAISGGIMPDLLTYYAAAAIQTKKIKFGTSIIPILPRHPTVLIAQALVLENLAPGRLRLGIGTSHKYIMETIQGLSFDHPLTTLNEYISILRQGLWDGKIDFSGKHYNIHKLALPADTNPPKTPLLLAALREKAFRLAGEIADGAISWMCPIEYLISVAKPSLQNGSEAMNRSVPKLIAHVPVAYSNDFKRVLAASQKQLNRYGKMYYYAKMFSDAGFPVDSNGDLSTDLIENLVIYGTDSTIRQKLEHIKSTGIDELLIQPVIIENQIKEEEALMNIIGD